eukprot:SAG22_NODE_7413_length_742_cov_1.153966_1_plen_183_part_01
MGLLAQMVFTYMLTWIAIGTLTTAVTAVLAPAGAGSGRLGRLYTWVVVAPISWLLHKLAVMLFNPLAWLLSPLTTILYPVVGTVLVLYGGEGIFDGEATDSNNCVTLKNIDIKPWMLGWAARPEFNGTCAPAIKAVGALLFLGGVCMHVKELLVALEGGVMHEALQKMFAGRFGAVLTPTASN